MYVILTKYLSDEELIEFIAERDEALLETYMDNGFDQDLWTQTLKQ